MLLRHVARVEVHLRRAAVIPRDEAEQYFREEAPLLRPEPAHDAEINSDQASVRIDKQVAGMHIGMKEAVAQRVTQEALDHLAAKVGQIEAARAQSLAVV